MTGLSLFTKPYVDKISENLMATVKEGVDAHVVQNVKQTFGEALRYRYFATKYRLKA